MGLESLSSLEVIVDSLVDLEMPKFHRPRAIKTDLWGK